LAIVFQSGQGRADQRDADDEHARASLNAQGARLLRYRQRDELAIEHVRPGPGDRLPHVAGAAGGISPIAVRSYLQNLPVENRQADAFANEGLPLRFDLDQPYSVKLEFQRPPGAGPHAAAAPLAAVPPAAPTLLLYEFKGSYRGIPIDRASQGLLARPDGAVVFVRRRYLPRAIEPNLEATVKYQEAVAVAEKDAAESFRALFPDPRAPATARDKSRPIPQFEPDTMGRSDPREIWVDKDRSGHLCWTFILRPVDKRRLFARQYWIAAQGAAVVLDSEDKILFAQGVAPVASNRHRGKVMGSVWPLNKSAFNDASCLPLSDLELSRDGQGGGTALTATDGSYEFVTGSGPATVIASLAGPYCIIKNSAGDNVARRVMGDGTTPLDLAFLTKTTEEVAQLSAFKWVNHAHAFVKDYLPASLVRLHKVPTYVNIDDPADPCNAAWDPTVTPRTLNFNKGDGTCPNKADSSIISHEYGHGVDDEFNGILDPALSEGFGDSLAMLITRTPVIGPDFNGPGKNLRNSEDLVVYPDSGGEVHHRGQIYAGFTWELIKRLTAKVGENEAYARVKDLTLGAGRQNPSSIPQAVRFVLFRDYQNGSPFRSEIEAAANSRKIPLPKDYGDLSSPYVNP